jgi:DNA-binding YbaB/EbfC family protein
MNLNRNDLMAQLAQMQEKLAKAQEDIKNALVEGTSGGGAVRVEITGEYEIKSLKIEPEVIDPDDAAMLEDLVIAALNEALSKVQAMHAEPLAGMGGLPGLGGMPGMPNIPGLGGGAPAAGGDDQPQMPMNRAARRAQKK